MPSHAPSQFLVAREIADEIRQEANKATDFERSS